MINTLNETKALAALLEGDEDEARTFLGELSDREIGSLGDAIDNLYELLLEIREERHGREQFRQEYTTYGGDV